MNSIKIVYTQHVAIANSLGNSVIYQKNFFLAKCCYDLLIIDNIYIKLILNNKILTKYYKLIIHMKFRIELIYKNLI